MYKLVLFFAWSAFVVIMQAVQFDQQLAVQTLFHTKHALDRAVHAAAQQIDLETYASGNKVIDPDAARHMAHYYLQNNLQLDDALIPYPGSFLKEQVEVLEINVINEAAFPQTYVSQDYNYQVTVDAPAVMMIIRVVYPRTFNLFNPIVWEIKGTAEMVDGL